MSTHSSKFHSAVFAVLKRLRLFFAIMVATLILNNPLPHQVEAATGDLDPTFGIGGKVLTDFFGGADNALDMVIQSDDKIIAAGIVVSSTNNFDFGLARYLPNGLLDSSFGVNGKVTTDFFNDVDLINAVKLQSDGKIVAVGSARLNSSPFDADLALARYNPDGSLDSTFDMDGKVSTDFLNQTTVGSAVVIQPNGKIVALGQTSNFFTGGTSMSLARYNADGSLDDSFGNAGKVNLIVGENVYPNALAIQPDGKLVAGSAVTTNTTGFFTVMRFNTNGTLDNSFGTAGTVFTDFSGQAASANDVLIQPNGKILAVGSIEAGVTSLDLALVRYNSDGSLDSSFGSGGKTTRDISAAIDELLAVKLQPDGKIVAAGSTAVSGANPDIFVVRYNQDGSPDSSFGDDGVSVTDFSDQADLCFSLGLQSKGEIVLAGYTHNSTVDIILARYQNSVVNFDVCMQDDSSGNTLQFNSTTGEYHFNQCNGLTLTGTGQLSRRGCVLTLQHNAGDRRLLAKLDTCLNKGSATVQLFSPGALFTILDRNITNNSCSCR